MPQPVGSIEPERRVGRDRGVDRAAALLAGRRAPTCVASGWLVAAIACGAITSERVANGRPVMRSPAVGRGRRTGRGHEHERGRRMGTSGGGTFKPRTRIAYDRVHARAGGNERLRVPRVEGDLLSGGPPRVAVPGPLRRALRHRRDQQHVLPVAQRLDDRGLGTGGPPRGSSTRSRPRRRSRTSSGSRTPRARSNISGRSRPGSGSTAVRSSSGSRPTSRRTSRASRTSSPPSRPADVRRSSSATSRGSRTTSTTSCERGARPSASPRPRT